jgi:hypothetical protein
VSAPACPACGFPQIPRPGRSGVLVCVQGHGLAKHCKTAPSVARRPVAITAAEVWLYGLTLPLFPEMEARP